MQQAGCGLQVSIFQSEILNLKSEMQLGEFMDRVTLPTNNDKVGAVMVVGGGIAGIQASLDLAESGYFVYVVEKAPGIGGVMAQLDKTFPTHDCAM